MKVIQNTIIPFGSYKAMTIGPWIFVKPGTVLSEEDINHEAIHWEQQKELLVIPFLILYGLSYVWELIRCTFDSDRGASETGRKRSLWKRAYRSIIFEREAYLYEKDLTYIKTRKHYAWLR